MTLESLEMSMYRSAFDEACLEEEAYATSRATAVITANHDSLGDTA